MTRFLFLALLFALPSSVLAQNDYFSLQPGNEWTFFDTTPDTVMRGTWRILEGPVIDEEQYVVVEFAGRAADTLRKDDNGRILAYHSGQDWLLFDFDLPEGSQYSFVTSGTPVTLVATVHRDVSVEWREGTFHGGVRFVFEEEETGRFDRSFTFAPGVGFIHYETEGGAQGRLYSAVVDGRVITSLSDDLIVQAPHAVSIYPNPVSEGATIEIGELHGTGAVLRLYDVTGRVADVVQVAPFTDRVAWLRPEGLAPGVYFFQLQTQTNITTRPVVLR